MGDGPDNEVSGGRVVNNGFVVDVIIIVPHFLSGDEDLLIGGGEGGDDRSGKDRWGDSEGAG